MKALLTQFTGGDPTKGDIMSAAGSGSQKTQGDSAGADASSFMGLMRGFLGMNEKPAAAANGGGFTSPEANKEGKKLANGASMPGIPAEISGKNNTGEAALMEENKTENGASGLGILNETSGKNNGKAVTLKSGEGEAKNTTNSMPADKKLSTRPTKQTVKNISEATSFKADGTEGEEKMIKNTDGKSGKETANVPAKAEKANANGNIKPAEAAAGKDPQQLKAKTKGEAPEEETITIKGEKTGTDARRGVSEKVAAKSENVQAAAGRTRGDRVPAPDIDTSSTSGEKQANSRKRNASGVRAENILKPSAGQKSEIVNEGKKNPAVAADVMKKAQQKQGKKMKIKAEKGRAPETSARRPAAQGSQSTSASVQSSESLLRKPAFNVKNLTPGKMVSSEMPGKVETEADAPHSKDAGPSPEKSFKEIHLNEFKSTRLTETAGRKKFSKHLSEVGRQQSGKSRETAQQENRWKQHRFVLKDGKALNISARSADGALHLQLNAGNSDLGKMLHRHLQDIRQHVQQELNIKVELQLQDFSGGQSEQQQEADDLSQTPAKGSSGSGERRTIAAPETASGTERVRYLGFNKNEWTA